jgi:hypothetical protein
MWARDGQEMGTVAGMRLRDLCLVDGRDQECRDMTNSLRRFGKLGVNGPFAALFGQENRYTAEVAAIYAEHFHRLGYLTVDRLLVGSEWSVATDNLRDRISDRDVRRSEIVEEFGPPSLAVDKRVLCYAPSDGSGWMFVDCWVESQTRYVPDEGHFETTSLDRSVSGRAVAW